MHESQDFNEWLASDFFFYSTSFRAATGAFEFSLSFGLLYPFYFYDQLKYKQQYHFPLTVGQSLLWAQTAIPLFTLLVPQSYRVSRQVPHLWDISRVCWGKAGASCRKAVQTASQPTHLHCFRSGVMCCSGLFRWKRLIKKGPVHRRKNRGIEGKESPAQHWQSVYGAMLKDI